MANYTFRLCERPLTGDCLICKKPLANEDCVSHMADTAQHILHLTCAELWIRPHRYCPHKDCKPLTYWDEEKRKSIILEKKATIDLTPIVPHRAEAVAEPTIWERISTIFHE